MSLPRQLMKRYDFCAMTRTIKGWAFVLLLACTAFSQQEVRISAGVAAANLVERVHAVYPALARAAEVQGTVVLEVHIDPEGAVSDTRWSLQVRGS